MLTSEVFKGAAAAIRARGHHKGSLYAGRKTTGPVCALGAIWSVLGGGNAEECDEHREHPAYAAISDLIAPGKRGHVSVWNDRPERTAAEVIDALERAAVIEAAKEAQTTQAIPEPLASVRGRGV